jgi:DNA-binding NarL/FixJ family response regulator
MSKAEMETEEVASAVTSPWHSRVLHEGDPLMGFWNRRTLDSVRPILSRDELRRRSRLLVIDDERPDLVDDLQHSGFAVDYVADVNKQNFGVLDRPTYDAILLDFGNVGTTVGPDQGLTLLRHIKRVNPATVVLAYTSKALVADQADFFRLADGVLAKDAGIAESMEKIEETLRKAHSVENVWRGLLNVAGIEPGSSTDKHWQKLAVRAIEKPKTLPNFKASVMNIVGDEAAQRVGLILIEKIVELGVKSALGHP